MKKIIWVFCVCAVFLGAMGSANATVPQLMPVQGVLTDSVGTPINGPTTLTFSIYPTATLGTATWTDVYTGGDEVDVQDGFFTVYLGELTNPLLLDFAAPEQWLGITVETDTEMPRIRLASVPFALESQMCRQLGALDEGDADDLAVLIDTGCPLNTAFRAFDGSGGLICDADDTGAGGGITVVNGTAPITASTVGGTVTVGVTMGTTASTVAEGNHGHDHGVMTGLADDDHTQYFYLTQNETVNGDTSFGGEAYFNNITEFNSEVYFYQRPSFSYSGASSPFLVSSTAVVTNLNSDQLDGQHGSYYSASTHTHDHGAMTGLADDDHTQYFNLSQAEAVTAIPAFNGGVTGTSAPFTVDSTTLVTSLNADLLDGLHSSSFATSAHNHTGTYIPMMTCTTNYVLKYDGDSWECAADNDTNTTYTAGTGLTLTGTQFSVDTSVIQSRVSGTCAEGTAIRAVSSSGTVTCQQVTPPTPTEMGSINMSGTAVSSAWTQLSIGTKTFSKTYSAASTKIELSLNSRINAGTFTGATGVLFELRVDGVAADVSDEVWLFTSAATEQVHIHSYFMSLGAGNHTVTLWARTNAGTSAGVFPDPGGWGGKIIAKEY